MGCHLFSVIIVSVVNITFRKRFSIDVRLLVSRVITHRPSQSAGRDMDYNVLNPIRAHLANNRTLKSARVCPNK